MKRAKTGSVSYVETKSEYSKYTCPHCKVNITGAGINRYVTRFLCMECNEEIIVKR